MKENNIILFDKSDNSAEIIKSYIADLQNIKDLKIFNDDVTGLKYLETNNTDIVIISANIESDNTKHLIKSITEKNISIILISEKYTTNTIIQALRYGIKDVLSKPVIKKDLISAIEKCTQDEVKALNKSKIITIFSNKGGIGKTTIATNLAVEFARQSREKVLLIDLNLPLGDVTTFINIKPTISISSAIENVLHNGKDSIINACQQYKNTSLYVLAEPVYMEGDSTLTPVHISKMFSYLRETFSYIVVDMGTNVDKMNMKILELTDLILLVSIVNLPLIRNCQRCLDLFKNLNYNEDKIKIIINRYLENDEISIEDVEKVLNQKIYWKIPNNYFAVMSSINKNLPVCELNENSNITLSFSGLTTKLTEDIIKNETINRS